MEGHGVVEVEIPDIEPVPGSKYAIDFYLSTVVVRIPNYWNKLVISFIKKKHQA